MCAFVPTGFGGIKMRTTFLQVAVLSLLVAATGAASPIIYGVSLSIGATGHVNGFIETDGTIGTLGAGNIIDWSLKITDGVDTPDTLLGPLSGNSSFVSVLLSDQLATPSAILYDLTTNDNGYFFFESSSNTDFVCFGPGGADGFNGICALGVASNVEGISLNHNEQNTPFTVTQVATSTAPEPGSLILMIAGLSLVAFLKLRRVSRREK
jgi:hypothetical protein